MRILSIYFRNHKGGFTKRLYKLYIALASVGDEVHFMGSEQIPVDSTQIIQHTLGIPSSNRISFMFWLRFIVISIFKSLLTARRQHIERIVVFGPFYTVLCILPILILGLPAITFIRADNRLHSSNKLRNAIFYIVDWIGIALSSRLVFVSSALEREYLKRYRFKRKKSAVIPNSIETEYSISPSDRDRIRATFGVDKSEFLIATAGMLNEGKNFSYLIRTMSLVKTCNVKLVIIGDGVNGERARLEEMAAELGVASHVIFAGWQEDPKPLMASSDLFAFPSKHEGSPNALLEALGCGVPCFGSNTVEIAEVLQHEELLFPLSDPRKLAERIIALTENQKFYEHVTALSRERCITFSFDWGKRVASVIHSSI
jgi:glycosyltransferase involved in cell wall biosynthesis